MGLLASGDAYTHRYDLIVAGIPRLMKCIDDAFLYDDDIGPHWWRIIDFLEKVGSHGMVLNPDKFQFSFWITNFEVKPLSKHLTAIQNFPQPRNITDVRSWFGLVNQVAHYGQLTAFLAPFCSLLSPRSRFEWTSDLDALFQQSKQAIIEAIENGVEIFDPQLTTCLQTDYSCQGIGYWLRLMWRDRPTCCPDGWCITLAGLRFLRDAELWYAPIEGECLAVAWVLENTCWFTMGCKDLVVATDHKPLIKILGDSCLDDIRNPRLPLEATHDDAAVQDLNCDWRVQPRCRRHIPIPVWNCYTLVWGPLSHMPVHGARWHWWRHTRQQTGWHQGLWRHHMGRGAWRYLARPQPTATAALHMQRVPDLTPVATSRSPRILAVPWLLERCRRGPDDGRPHPGPTRAPPRCPWRTPHCPSRCLLYAESCPSLSVLAWII